MYDIVKWWKLKIIVLFKKVNPFKFRYCFIYEAMVFYLACTIFSGKLFFNKLASISVSVFLNVSNILIHIGMAFSDVLDIVEAAFCQKYTAKWSTFTVTMTYFKMITFLILGEKVFFSLFLYLLYWKIFIHLYSQSIVIHGCEIVI